MKNLLRLTLVVLAFAFTASVANAQTASSDLTACDSKICPPAMCDLMVKLGICSPEQAAKCKGESTDTKVASVVMERAPEMATEEKPETIATSCRKSNILNSDCCASAKVAATIE